MKHSLFVTISLFLITFNVWAISKNAEKQNLSFEGGIYLNSVDSEQNESRLSGVKLSLLHFQKINPFLQSLIKASAYLETGSNKSLFISEYAPTQSLELNQGFIEFTPLDFISFKAGAISQDFLKYPLLVDDSAFLSAQEKILFNIYGSYYAYLLFSQAIPNNSLVSSRSGVVDNGTPKVFTHSLGLDLDGDLLGFNFLVTHFSFKQLPSSVAHQSRFMGNQVSGIGQDNAEFLYGFEGINFNISSKLSLSPEHFFLLSYGHLFNNKAPDSRNESHHIKANYQLYDLGFIAELFSNKSDTVPAFYNDKIYGHNNREGFLLGVNLNNPSSKVKTQLVFTHSTLIEEDLRQSDLQFIQLKFTKKYDL